MFLRDVKLGKDIDYILNDDIFVVGLNEFIVGRLLLLKKVGYFKKKNLRKEDERLVNDIDYILSDDIFLVELNGEIIVGIVLFKKKV